MKVTANLSQPGGDPAAVFAMLTDRSFQQQKCAATGALSSTVTVEVVQGRTRVTTSRQMPTDGLPDFARALVHAPITVEEIYDWDEPAPDGSRTAVTTVSFVGQPLRMTGTLTLRPVGEGTEGVLSGELKAAIPLFGGKIEAATEPVIRAAAQIEQDLGRSWLAGERG